MSTADRALSKALHKLDSTNFEIDPGTLNRTPAGDVIVPLMWLVTVLEALGAFIDTEGWMK